MIPKKIPREIDLPSGRAYLVDVKPTREEAESKVKFLEKWFTDVNTMILPVKLKPKSKEMVYAVYRIK